jgi:hypothetical protein
MTMAFKPKKLLTGIPLVGGAFDETEEKAMEELRRNQALYEGLQDPSFANYNPEGYQYLGDYSPEMMDAETISEDPSLRGSQMSVLEDLAGLSKTGLTDVDALGYEKARDLGNQMARSGTQAAIQNAAARGVGGSGLEFAMREIANQEGAERAQNAALEQAAESARQKALYTQAYGNMLSGVRNQDFGVNRANTDILNQFNQMNTQNRNEAAQYNLGNRQNMANANVDNRNKAFQYNQGMKQQAYDNKLKKLAGQTGANTGMAGGYAAQNAAQNAERNANTALVVQGVSAAAGSPKGARTKTDQEDVEWGG